jgi:hypothetical protein
MIGVVTDIAARNGRCGGNAFEGEVMILGIAAFRILNASEALMASSYCKSTPYQAQRMSLTSVRAAGMAQ